MLPYWFTQFMTQVTHPLTQSSSSSNPRANRHYQRCQYGCLELQHDKTSIQIRQETSMNHWNFNFTAVPTMSQTTGKPTDPRSRPNEVTTRVNIHFCPPNLFDTVLRPRDLTRGWTVPLYTLKRSFPGPWWPGCLPGFPGNWYFPSCGCHPLYCKGL